ncbi:MAG: hypothetical protein ABSG26_16795, partial [Bryobacteraceae bacterium]
MSTGDGLRAARKRGHLFASAYRAAALGSCEEIARKRAMGKLVKGFALGIPGRCSGGVHRINFQVVSLEDSDERLLPTP